MSNRAWRVRANSFARPDYEIEGVNIRDAVQGCLPRVLADIAPWLSVKSVLSMDLRWRPDILSGMGGAELTINVVDGGSMTSLVVWIGASKAETPSLAVWQRSGTSLRMIVLGNAGHVERDKEALKA